MEKSTFKKSKKQKTKQLEKEMNIYKKKSFEIIEKKSSNIDFIKFCSSNELNIHRVETVLKGFSIIPNENGEVPDLILNWIRDSEICSDKKINKSLDYVKEKDIDLVAEYKEFSDSISIKKHFHHRNEKKYLRALRVGLAHNRDLYRYLVKKNLLIDYRLNEQ